MVEDDNLEVPLHIQKLYYSSFCSNEEIERIFNVRNAHDYLLKLRADTIVDHMRLYRVYRNRALKNPSKWSLTQSFSQKVFQQYLALLDSRSRDICRDIPAGFVFSNDPNGACMKTPYGNIIFISNALEYFLFYMNIAHLIVGFEVPTHVRLASQRIAIRTMLKTEALDFDMDPRGKIPNGLAQKSNSLVKQQILFIVGHEYAHHIHGHLENNKTINQPIFARLHNESDDGHAERFYNIREQQEFEADSSSLAFIKGKTNPQKWGNIVYATLSWFVYLEIYQQVSDQLFPKSPWRTRTHPEPIERLHRIYSKFGASAGVTQEVFDDMLKNIVFWKDFFLEDVAVNIEIYEMYGSIYLDKPNTEWRGRELIDRVDYY